MRKLHYILTAAVLAVGFTVSSSVMLATPVIAKKEGGTKCVVCHTKGKELNKVGECYKTSKVLKECQDKK